MVPLSRKITVTDTIRGVLGDDSLFGARLVKS